MVNLYETAKKFAMKLGLESRPSVEETKPFKTPPELVEQTVEEEEPMSEEEISYLPRSSEFTLKYFIYELKLATQTLSQNLDLNDFDAMLETVSTMEADLTGMKEILQDKLTKSAAKSKKQSHKKASIDEGTIHHPEEPHEMGLLPHVLKEYTRGLKYMSHAELQAERKKLKKIVKQFIDEGTGIPYPLKMKLEQVENLLAMHSFK